MGWLNREPVVFVATAGDRLAVMLFSSLFTPVMRGLARVSYPRRRFLVPCTSLCLDLLPRVRHVSGGLAVPCCSTASGFWTGFVILASIFGVGFAGVVGVLRGSQPRCWPIGVISGDPSLVVVVIKEGVV